MLEVVPPASLELRRDRPFSKGGYKGKLTEWIPACAGMT